jgi:hypothetical protein
MHHPLCPVYTYGKQQTVTAECRCGELSPKPEGNDD